MFTERKTFVHRVILFRVRYKYFLPFTICAQTVNKILWKMCWILTGLLNELSECDNFKF